MWSDVILTPEFDLNGELGSVLVAAAGITSRKKSGHNIAILSCALDNLNESAFLIDEHLGFSYVNQKACDSLGYTREELLALTVADIDACFSAGQLRGGCNELKKKRSSIHESQHRKKDGTTFPVEVLENYLEFDGVWYRLSLCKDITERKRVEREREESLRFFQSMDKVNRIILQSNSQEKTLRDVLDLLLSIFACDQAYLVLPYDPEAAEGQVFMECTRPEYPGAFAMGQAIAMDQEYARTIKILLEEDGPVQFAQGTGLPWPATIAEEFGIKSSMAMTLHPGIGKAWQFGIHQCSHPRIWSLEDELLLKEIGWRLADGLTGMLTLKALRDSEEKYRMVVENSVAAVYILQEGYFRFVNKKWCETQGYEYEEVVDKIPLLKFVHPECRDQFLEWSRKQINGEASPQYFELKTLSKDGSTLVWKIMGEATQFRGKPAISGTAIDITREKELESMLLQSQKLEAIGTLAGGIAHTFNNILSALMGHTELAGLADDENVRQKHYQGILDSCERAKNLVDRILSISRKKEEERESVDATLMVKEVVKFLRSSLPTTIDIKHFVPPSPMVVSADPVWIHQIFMNLCTNAAHAMKGHTGVIRVSLEGVTLPDSDFSAPNLAPGPYVRLQVSDTGCGIAPDIRDRIFDPFFTTKDVGEGTGLGLSVVFNIVKTMGGEISLESEPGKGSTFTVHIPHIVSAAVALETDNRPAALPGGRERLLLVDDEKAILDTYRATFQHLGYDVVVKDCSLAALELFTDAPDRFDAVITDLTLPKMTGMEMAEKMTAIRPGFPILLNSGYTDWVDEKKASKIGIRKILKKPVPMKKLALWLRKVLDAQEREEIRRGEI